MWLFLQYAGDLPQAHVKAMTGTLLSQVEVHLGQTKSRGVLPHLESDGLCACFPNVLFQLNSMWAAWMQDEKLLERE